MRPAVLGLPVFGSVPFSASLVDYRYLSRCSIGPKVGAPSLRVGLPFWVGALGPVLGAVPTPALLAFASQSLRQLQLEGDDLVLLLEFFDSRKRFVELHVERLSYRLCCCC